MQKEYDYTEILSLITHDLKSPLASLTVLLDMLEIDTFTKDEKQEQINMAKKASKSLVNIVDNILIMSKHGTSKDYIKIEEILDIKTKFKDILNDFKFQGKLKKLNLEINIDDNLPNVVYWDFDKIEYHVINNILSNSFRFVTSDGTGKISFSAKKNLNNEIVIEIKDNGIGIVKSKRKLVFDKYETCNSVKSYKSMGLGLYNAKFFITKHKGKIEIIDGLEKHGVGFKIILPISSK